MNNENNTEAYIHDIIDILQSSNYITEHADKRQINRRLRQTLTIITYNQRKIITIITKKMKN